MPVESRNSPPPSHRVGSASSEACSQRISFPSPWAPAATPRPRGVPGPFGGFAGLFALDDERLLAASTDGLGTKLVLARRAGRLRDAGACLAAHCMNDVLTTGAEALFFLDYVAAGELDLADVAELVEGAAAVCREARRA